MKNPKELKAAVDSFNTRYAIGDRVHVQTPDGIKRWTVKAPASVAGGHTAVGWFQEHAACYSLEKVITS